MGCSFLDSCFDVRFSRIWGLSGTCRPIPSFPYGVSCRKFRDNAVFMRTLALPKEVEHWSLTTLREKLVKIGAKVVIHGRYVTFLLAEVAVPRSLFQKILSLIDDLRRRPVPA